MVQDKSTAPLLREMEDLKNRVALLEQTERIQREAELALRESEERYRRLVDHAPIAIFVHHQGEIIYCNLTGANLLEFDRSEDIIGRDIIDFIHPDYRSALHERLLQEDSLVEQAVPLMTAQLVGQNGQEIDVEVAAIPITYYNQEAVQVVVVDTSERIRAERAEREQRALNEALRDTAVVLSSTLDLNELVTHILDNVGRVVEHDAANIMLVEAQIVQIVGRRGYVEQRLDKSRLPVWESLNDKAVLRGIVRRGTGLAIPNTHQHPEWVTTPGTSWIKSYLGVPLISQGEVIGFMNLDSATAGFFSDIHLERLQSFATQAAIAIRNARLYKAEQQRRQVAETLRQATTVFNLTLELEDVLNALLRQLHDVIDCDTSTIQTLENDGLTVIACRGFQQSAMGLQFSLVEQFPNLRVIRDRTPLSLADARVEYPHFEEDSEMYSSGRIRSWLGVPMLIKDRVSGMITLDRHEIHPFSTEDIELALAFASQAAVAIENAELHRTMRERATRMELVAQASHTTANIYEMDSLLDQAVRLIAETFGYYLAIVLLIEGDHLVLRATSRSELASMVNRTRVRIGEEGITGWVARTGIPYVVGDVSKEPRYLFVQEAPETCSELAVPIIFREQVIGVLDVESRDLNAFTQADIATLQTVADQLAVAVHSAQLYRQVQNHAMELEVRVAERTAQLEAAMVRLEELDQLKSKFIADVSHELRTPVTNLSVYIDLIKHGKPEKHQEYVNILDEQLGRLKALVDDILDLTRIEMGAGQVTFGQVDLNVMIHQTVLAHRPNAEAKGLKLNEDLSESLPVIWGERNQLAQVASNLIANAINYTANGQIDVRTRPDGTRGVVVVVRDTGMGLEEDDIPYLFERFYRGRQVGQSNIPGTGLGLAIVREIVTLHNGQIDVESKPGEGTTFRVWLPVG